MESFLQPVLENENFRLMPLAPQDFERLYSVAGDPEIWVQHPNPDRYKREVFKNFFEGALASGGAFIITDKKNSEVVGSTRLYGYDEDENSIFIGYTFYSRKYWGSGVNFQVKKLMLDHAFSKVDLVKFHVGKENYRSRRAMEKLGAEYFGDVVVAYHGEPNRENVEYHIRKEDWQGRSQQ